jgi:hypothetical protein
LNQKQVVQGDCSIIRCIWENWIRNSNCFTLLSDDSIDADGHKKKFFTRTFAMKKFTNYQIAFVYDYKTKIATVSCDNIATQALSIEARKKEVDDSKILESIAKNKIS